jgi:CHRD domain
MSTAHRRAVRPAVVALASMFLAGAAGLAWGEDVKVTLTGGEETPPVATSATGTGTITVSGKDHAVKGSIKTTGIEGTMAHIHLGPPGQAGRPIITLTKGADGSWTVPDGAKLTDEQYASFTSGNLYVNVHSAAHMSGEVRGQLKP